MKIPCFTLMLSIHYLTRIMVIIKKQYLNCFVHMRLWELFSGTGSVARVAQDLRFSVIPLDLKDADANQDILSWDYKEFGVG